jgi:hypothetical protein
MGKLIRISPFTIALLQLILFVGGGWCQLVSWIYPPIAAKGGDWFDDLLFQVGSTQTLKWQSPYPTANITWFHNTNTGSDVSGHVIESEYSLYCYRFRC